MSHLEWQQKVLLLKNTLSWRSCEKNRLILLAGVWNGTAIHRELESNQASFMYSRTHSGFSTTKQDVCIEFSTANLFVLKPETLHKLLQRSLSELRIHTAEYYADMKIIWNLSKNLCYLNSRVCYYVGRANTKESQVCQLLFKNGKQMW